MTWWRRCFPRTLCKYVTELLSGILAPVSLVDKMNASHVRNFCIIAHNDHGKSTACGRLPQHTGALEARDRVDQVLDSMDLEREKGVTIQASAVRMYCEPQAGERYILNSIDTPWVTHSWVFRRRNWPS
jgi:translation elongation factor EF-4